MAGVGRGEGDVGKALRESWARCSTRLSMARYCPATVGSRAGPGPRTEQEARLLHPAGPPGAHTPPLTHRRSSVSRFSLSCPPSSALERRTPEFIHAQIVGAESVFLVHMGAE